MFLLVVTISALLAPALTRPQEPATGPVLIATKDGSTPIPILNQTDEANPDGSFQFSYETGNGIKVEQKGYQKDDESSTDKIQVIEGSVSYTDGEGNVINLRYLADENGFQPVGDHLPTTPTLPEAVANLLKNIPTESNSPAHPGAVSVAQPAPVVKVQPETVLSAQ